MTMSMVPLKEAALEPVHALWEAVVERAPAVLSALLILVGMWLLGRLIRSVVARVLGMTKLDHVAARTRLHSILEAFDKELTASKAIATLAYLAVLLMALMSASDILGLEALSAALSAALAFVPRLVGALLVFGVGGYVAATARRAVGAMLRGMHSPYTSALQLVTEIGLLVITAAIAVDVLGLDISFITSNLTVLVGVVLLTVAFLLCWSMRKPAEEIIANYYLRRLVNTGDDVDIGGIQGTVERFTAIGVLLRDSQGHERFVPARHVLDGLSCSARARRSSASAGKG